MKKTLNIFFLLLGLLAFKNIAYAETPIDACWNFNKAGDYKRAIEAGKLAVKKYPKNSQAYYCLGEAYYNVGEFKLAYENMKKAEKLVNNKKDLMYIYNKIGQILYNMGYLDDAIQYYTLSWAVFWNRSFYDKSFDDTDIHFQARLNYNTALVYDKKGYYQEAIRDYQSSIETDESFKDYYNASITKLKLGNVYRKIGNYKMAEKYLFEGLEGVKKAGNKEWEAVGYTYLGWLYRDKGDYKTARDYYTQAYDLFKSIGAEGDAQSVLNELRELDKSK
jgi:tetratricopeptide (TPR) repeat protein